MASTADADASPASQEMSTVIIPPPGGRRCFICLTDENEAGSSNSEWVNPCPCTLEGHQDCIMDWVTNLESEKKDIKCPVCKADIEIAGPWSPMVALSDRLHDGLSRVSPYLIAGSFATGTWIGLASYGNFAIRVFAGPEATYEFFFSGTGTVGGVPRFNWVHVAALPLIAPALIVGQSFPILGNVLFMPTAAFYGVFHMARDDHFLTWPPSPQLVVASFPYLRAIYRSLYNEFVLPYENRLDRRLLGQPEPEPEPEQGAAGPQNRDAARNGNGNRDGVLVGMIDNIIRFLEIPDVDVDVEVQVAIDNANDGEQGIEIVLEEVDELGQDEADDAAAGAEEGLPAQDQAEEVQPEPAAAAAVNPPAQQVAQPAPNNGRRQVQTSLRDATNAVASAMLLPVFSACMGELIRLALPRSWTSPTQFGRFRVRTGLLQDTWGRSLVGGCVFVVLRDALRLYTKYRKAQNKPLRRVKNVDRRRNKSA